MSDGKTHSGAAVKTGENLSVGSVDTFTRSLSSD